MKSIVIYLVASLITVVALWWNLETGSLPEWVLQHRLAINCLLIATLGGILYCTRAVYVNYCPTGNWDTNWNLWYYLRPLTSAITGLIAFIFLKAGIVILEAENNASASNFGYLAFCFIAGYNVDRFLQKIEDLAKSVFGIEKTRAAERKDNER